ncbi:MAG: glycosyltransferase family 2 protein [Clostridia bacterium]|nr:glycosyltransferase family 2 protein [Clostridia bacterium]
MKVSVYCLVYNHEKYLKTALQGFVSQKTNFDYEVFVHDDASTDGSKLIVEEYAWQYPQIIKPIYQQENQYSKGVSIFTTFILPKMSGEYVAVCEGDDCWTDSLKLQRQVDFLDGHPDYVACVHNTMKKDMRTNRESEMFEEWQDKDILFADVIRGHEYSYHLSSLMYRIQYAYQKKPHFFDTAKKAGVGDLPLAIFLTLSGKVRFLNYNMSLYRIGTEHSWTKRLLLDMNQTAYMCECLADMLDEVNCYTEHRYDKALKTEILKRRYDALFFSEKYEKLYNKPYRSIFYSNPFSYRIKIYIKQNFNGLYHYYRKIVYGRKN